MQNRRLGVMLVGGFFGAGKSSLLHHFLSEQKGGYQAVVVEACGAINHDALAFRGLLGARRRLYDLVLPVPSLLTGSALVPWLNDRLREITQAGLYERVWIELSGVTDIRGLAREFRVLPDQPEGLSRFAYLMHAVVVVDGLDFLRDVVVAAQRKQPGPWVDFHHSQVESATVVILNKCDLMDDEERGRCQRLLRVMNPDALIIETDYGEVPPEIWDKPGTLQQAGLATERLLRLSPDGGVAEIPRPGGAVECGALQVWRPLHPKRFWDWFEQEHRGLLRVKGLIWLATRNQVVGGISRTTWENSCGGAGFWWAALPKDDWPEAEERLQGIRQVWTKPYGDRRQELTIICNPGALEAVVESLKTSLLTDDELAAGPDEWMRWEDPFPVWDLE